MERHNLHIIYISHMVGVFTFESITEVWISDEHFWLLLSVHKRASFRWKGNMFLLKFL